MAKKSKGRQEVEEKRKGRKGEKKQKGEGKGECVPPKWRETGRKYANKWRVASEFFVFFWLKRMLVKIEGYSDLP
ncbi:MAG: hypothetical protein HLX50_23155 [Alteromonadaceae bacterium]|nr:hypothetical protein [Alteromonadaceae bacterium]